MQWAETNQVVLVPILLYFRLSHRVEFLYYNTCCDFSDPMGEDFTFVLRGPQ